MRVWQAATFVALTVAVVAVAFLFAACGGSDDTRIDDLEATIAALADDASVEDLIGEATPTVPVIALSATTLPDRLDCAAIRGTDYRSSAEREWFLANCLPPTPTTAPLLPVAEFPPIGDPVAPGISDTPSLPVPDGAHLAADDGQFLGVVTCNTFDSDGIFNMFGPYGSQFSSTSIWNRFGSYGGQFGRYSPFNMFATAPIIYSDEGQVYLTMEGLVLPRVTPIDLVLGCFATDPTQLSRWLGQIGDQ